MVEFQIDNSSQLHREIKELVTMACGRWNESTELVSKDTTDRIMAAVNDAMVRANRRVAMEERRYALPPQTLIDDLRAPDENFSAVEDRVQRTRDIWETMRCPECRAGKHPNCTETMLDLKDRPVPCMCFQVGHTIPSWQ